MTNDERLHPTGEPADQARFAGLTFDDFRRMAVDESLTRYERIGFPDAYRGGGAEAAILDDIVAKLLALEQPGSVVVDIGPGCSDLPRMLRERCFERGQPLVFVDSAEMLAHHEDGAGLEKIPARFPDCPGLLAARAQGVHAVLVYSVIQYAFGDASVFDFLDAALGLLAPGGRLLLGDIPNASMRRRFLASEAGAAHHRAWSADSGPPEVRFNSLDRGEIDDAVVLALVSRARAAGFDAWIVPQAPGLPMANRREDLIVERP